MDEASARRFVVVHGHFYQPPRENPWLELVERDPGAAPFHDWNERVCREAYWPNAWARLLGEGGCIRRIASNYERISFDFGPSLLRWLEREAPELYRAVLEADQRSRVRFAGHGAAIAQAYSHAIMPLLSERDRRTEVRWALADFRRRFGRDAEGMWLPECAVCTATLSALAEAGIAFTILAPHQAACVRPIGEGRWTALEPGVLEHRMPYLCRLPQGRRIAVFFYDGDLAQRVAFGDLLQDGERLADALLNRFDAEPSRSPLRAAVSHFATDGETYGHHKKFGEMALARALERIEEETSATLSVYAAVLAEQPPTHEVEIVERSSWSCVHGVERWRSDCGCGRLPGTQQRWRAPLRRAFDVVRAEIDRLFERRGEELFHDPWRARDRYVDVVLDRSEQSRARFLGEQARRPRDRAAAQVCFELLEMQRHALAMYTSCGWFFEDIARPEPVQVMRHAARAVELAERHGASGLEERLVRMLERAPGNDPALADGAAVWRSLVVPARYPPRRVAAHFAALLGLGRAREDVRLGVHRLEAPELERSGGAATGRFRVVNENTLAEEPFSFAFAPSWRVAVREAATPPQSRDDLQSVLEALGQGDERVLLMFASVYELAEALFEREREALAAEANEQALAELDRELERIERRYARAFSLAAQDGKQRARLLELGLCERAIVAELRAKRPRPERLHALIERACERGLELDRRRLAGALGEATARLLECIQEPGAAALLAALLEWAVQAGVRCGRMELQNRIWKTALGNRPEDRRLLAVLGFCPPAGGA